MINNLLEYWNIKIKSIKSNKILNQYKWEIILQNNDQKKIDKDEQS